MKFLSPNKLFFAVLCIAFVTRFYKLGFIPVGPDWDEAAIGYNAFSLLATGKDEYGHSFPLVFRSFNDYKPPLYVYATVPAVALFGLSTWSVRLPSAIIGVLAVAGTYALVRELLAQASLANRPPKNKYSINVLAFSKQDFSEIKSNTTQYFPLLPALLLAISPWHLQFSRVAFEASIGIAFNIWGTVFLLRGFIRPKYLYFSGILFGLGMYAYHAQRIFIPFYIMLLVYLSRVYIIRHKKEIFIFFSIIALFMLPVVYTFLGNYGLQRLSGTSILRKQTEYLQYSVQKFNWDKAHGSLVGQILNDRRIEWSKVVLGGYLSHFSPKWLFVTGDYPRHHAPDSGLLYIWTAPLLFVGLLVTFQKYRLLFVYLTGWLLIAPIASSLTYEVPHAVRSIVFLPAFEIIISFGLWQILTHLIIRVRNNISIISKVFYSCITVCCSILVVVEIVRYFNLYFVHMNYQYSTFWQYGYEQAIDYVRNQQDKFDKIIVSTDLEQPYIFFLFFTKYPPRTYLAGGGSEVKNFGKYYFRPIDWNSESMDINTLYVDTYANSPGSNDQVIYSLAGEPVIAIRSHH